MRMYRLHGPFARYNNPLGIIRRNPGVPRTRESERAGSGGGAVPVLVIVGTAAAVFGIVYYLGRRRQQQAAQGGMQAPGGQRLPPGSTGLNEFGYPIGYDGVPMIGSAWNWPPPGVAVGYNAQGQLIDATGAVVTTAQSGPQPGPLPTATSTRSGMPPA